MESTKKYLYNFFGKDLPISGRLITCLDNIEYAGKLGFQDIWRAIERSLPEISNFYSFISADTVSFEKKRFKRQKRLIDNSDEFKKILLKTFSGSSVQNDKYFFSNPNDLGIELIRSEKIDILDFAYGILSQHRYSRNKKNRVVVNSILERIINHSKLSEINIEDPEQFKSIHKLVKSYFYEHPLKSQITTQEFAIQLENDVIKINPIGTIGYASIQPILNYTDEINIIHPTGISLNEAIIQLEFLINKNSKEQEFQDFFESNPDFLRSLGDYSEIYPHVVLKNPKGGSLIPDFFLKRINSDLCDICDIKRPISDIIRYQNNRVRFRDALMEGIAQLKTYRDYFENPLNRDKVVNDKGLLVFHPKVILIIGKRSSYNSDIDRIRLESDLPRYVNIKTYDDILNRMKFWHKRMINQI